MKTKYFLFICVLSFFASQNLWALDPVAPRAERKYGELTVQTPLASDVCSIKMTKDKNRDAGIDYQQSFKPGETIKIPVGDYELKVKLQDREWTTQVTIHPTERTDVKVTGYGNLKVNSPSPNKDTVEVATLDGKVISTFHPSQVKTLPNGTYNVTVKMSGTSITQPNVMIITNTTREVSAAF